MDSGFGLRLNPLASSKALFPTSLLSNAFSVPSISRVSSASLWTERKTHKLKFKQPLRSSAEGLPDELIEDSKFVPLTAEEPRYGPPAILLLGFELNEAGKIHRFLKELDGEFLKVLFCTEDMINQPLWEVMNTEQPNLDLVKIPKSLPRICFLSGLTGEEMMMFIDAFPETGLEPAVFAALVPNSADKPLRELIEEIMGDHEMLTSKQSPAA